MPTPEQVSASVRAHYLSLPGRTEDGWREIVLRDPRKFNRVWRHWLGLPADDAPPPSHHWGREDSDKTNGDGAGDAQSIR